MQPILAINLFFVILYARDTAASWEEWWTYDGISGPAFWGLINPQWNMCSKGRRQSPIDIEPDKLLFDPYLRPLHIDKHKVSGVLQNTGQSLVFRIDKDTKQHVNISGGPLAYRYQFEEIYIHYGIENSQGSEHKIHGYHFPGEIQLYGFNKELYHNMSEAQHKSQGIVGISVMIQIGETPNAELRIITSTFNKFYIEFYLLIVILMVWFSTNVNCYPVAKIESNGIQKERLDIYKRQNSEFNRLLSNNADYSAYESINDQAQNEDSNDINTAESRRFGGGLKKRPCVPVYGDRYRRHKKRRRNDGRINERYPPPPYDGPFSGPYSQRYSGQNDGRTLYDLNFYFLGYQPTHYQVNPATQTVSAIAAVDNNRPVSSNYGQNDHSGGYYDCEPNLFYRPPLLAGSNYYGSGTQYDDPNRPSYLGLLGQGLFDFVNGLFGYGNPNAGSGGYDTPVSSGAGTILNDADSNKPVFEINVPDTIAALGSSTPIRHISLRSLIPNTDAYMTYEGSTTHPGCWESTVWIILNKPIYITKQELYALRRLMQGSEQTPKAPLGNNARPVQNLHHRTVRKNIDFKQSKTQNCPTMYKDMFYKANKWTVDTPMSMRSGRDRNMADIDAVFTSVYKT